MTKQEAVKAISEKTNQAMKLIREAERLADETGTGFEFKITYGMGGYYRPMNPLKSKALAKLSEEERIALGIDDDSDPDSGWQSSSRSC